MTRRPSTHDERPSTMLALVETLPRQLRESEALLSGVSLPRPRPGRGVIVCGLGGSAAAATLVQGCTLESGPRVDVVRSYSIPAALDADATLIFSSYSGNTEETLAAYDQASVARPNATRVVISSGGALVERARRDGVGHVPLPAGLPPRASLGFGLGALVRALGRLGQFENSERVLDAAATRLEEGNTRFGPGADPRKNPARALASALRGRMALLYASEGPTAAAAQRWRAQINENGKALASVALLPELNHNEVVGWEADTDVRNHLVVVALRDADEHARLAARFEITREVLGDRVPRWEEVRAQEGPALVRALDLVQQGDFLSVYLAEEHGVDPLPVRAIDRLKERLAQLD